MSASSGWGAGDEQGAKNILVVLARWEEAFLGEAFRLESATFVAVVLAFEFFLPLLFYLAATFFTCCFVKLAAATRDPCKRQRGAFRGAVEVPL